jgi:hypothetical protein
MGVTQPQLLLFALGWQYPPVSQLAPTGHNFWAFDQAQAALAAHALASLTLRQGLAA